MAGDEPLPGRPRPPAAPAREDVVPEDPAARLRLADELLARGEALAARELLQPFEASSHPFRRDALLRLATLDENEGRAGDARKRWERLLADDIDDDRAWSQLTRLRPLTTSAVEALAGPSLTPPTLDSAAGMTVGRFEIVRELGRGSSATVYLARDRALDLELALKMLHPAAGVIDRDRAFFHEARAVAGLRHPGVVAIYDVDEPARTLVMEFVPGGTVRDRLRAGQGAEVTPRGLDPAEVLALGRRLLATLAFVHDHGVVHGDLTPRNVLLRAAGDPVLVDFGIARTGEGPGPAEEAAGTPLYLAPERMRGAPASERTDLFAAGALLWEALVGRPMRSHADLVAGTIESRPLPAELVGALPSDAHADLPRLIAALTAGAPEQRPATAAEALGLLG